MGRMFTAAQAARVVAAVALAGATLLAGCRAHRGHGHGPGGPAEIQERVDDHVERLLRIVDATDDQKARILALKQKLMPHLVELPARHRTLHEEIGALWARPTLEASALHELVDQRAEEFQRLAHDLADAAAELHAILTPEQRQKLKGLHGRFGHH